MDFKEYFASVQGTGVISTADDKGEVNSAIYAAPYSTEDGQLSFIMRERKTHKNIGINPHACYLFIEGGKMTGKRFYLTKVKEEKNSETLTSYRYHGKKNEGAADENLYQVFFKVDKILPLIGSGEDK